MKGIVVLGLTLLSFVSLAQSSTDDILRRAEVMPVFQQCEEERFVDAPYPCTMKQLSDFFREVIVVENPMGMQTKCVLSLVVEKDGSVSNVQLQRGVIVKADNPEDTEALAASLDAVILEKAQNLSFILPGYQNGEKARVMLQFSASVNY
jgi:hypothetical protein